MPEKPTWEEVKKFAAVLTDKDAEIYGICLRGKPGWGENMGFPKGNHWLWAWALAIPRSSNAQEAAKQFILWATSKEYVELVGETEGWTSVPPGTRQSTYDNPNYLKAAPFVLQAIRTADPTDNTVQPSPYNGIQYVGIPELQAIGTQVGQTVAAVLAGNLSVDEALRIAQSYTARTMRRARYTR